MTKCSVRYLSGAAAVLFSSSVFAQTFLGPSPYLSQNNSPFAALIGTSGFFLETFEDGALNTPGVTASTGSVIGPGGLTDSVDADDGSIDGSGTNGHSMFAIPGSTGITFTFDASVLGGLPTRVGIVWTDGEGTTTFEAFGPGGVPLGQIGPVAIADASVAGTTAEDRFFGVIHTSGISSIRISNTVGGIEVDHLQYGVPASAVVPSASIPVPALTEIGFILLLLMLGWVGMRAVRNHRSNWRVSVAAAKSACPA